MHFISVYFRYCKMNSPVQASVYKIPSCPYKLRVGHYNVRLPVKKENNPCHFQNIWKYLLTYVYTSGKVVLTTKYAVYLLHIPAFGQQETFFFEYYIFPALFSHAYLCLGIVSKAREYINMFWINRKGGGWDQIFRHITVSLFWCSCIDVYKAFSRYWFKAELHKSNYIHILNFF